MKHLARFIVAAVLLTLSSGALTASLASQTFKIKTSKGRKANLALTLNDATGDVLVAFESGGEILATLAKQSGNGTYKAKKAKRVSGGGGGNHRPAVVFDPSVSEFLAAWDTGPEDLGAAAAAADHEASDILSRRIKRKNGKATKSVITTVSDGSLNIGPQLGVRRGAVEMFYTRHELLNASSRLDFVGGLIIMGVQQGVADGSAEQIQELRDGLSQIVDLAVDDDDACIALTRYLVENPFADYMRIGIANGLAQYYNAQTGDPATAAFMKLLLSLDYKVAVWYEHGPSQQQRRTLMRFADGDGDMSGIVDLLGNVVSNMIESGAGTGRQRAGDRGWTAVATAASQVQLLEIGGAAQIFQRVDLMKRSKEIADMALVLLPGGTRAMLVWVEKKNAKSDDVWAHVFDLP